MDISGGVVSREGCLPRGCLPRECLPRGGMPGGYIPAFNGADRMTDSCENITFPQLLLRTVNIRYSAESVIQEMVLYRTGEIKLIIL